MNDSSHRDCIVSECHKAFTVIVGENYVCTQCGVPCQNINKDETVMISNKFNLSSSHTMDEAQNINLWHDAKNLYNDHTLQLVNHKCTDCGTCCRFARDYNNNAMFICSNKDCRHVFNEKIRIDNVIEQLSTQKRNKATKK